MTYAPSCLFHHEKIKKIKNNFFGRGGGVCPLLVGHTCLNDKKENEKVHAISCNL